MKAWRHGRVFVKREAIVSQREAELVHQLAEEKARTAAVLADFEAYMREHQMLKARERAR